MRNGKNHMKIFARQYVLSNFDDPLFLFSSGTSWASTITTGVIACFNMITISAFAGMPTHLRSSAF